MNVLIADKFSDQGMAALRQAGCEVIFNPELKDDALTKAIGETKPAVLVVRSTKVPKPMLEASPELKLVTISRFLRRTVSMSTVTGPLKVTP